MDGHYFAARPEGPVRTRPFRFRFRGREHEWLGAASVFSGGALDQGTSVLLEALLSGPLAPGARLLDLGCGTGILGLVARAEAPGLSVVMADVNAHAVACALLNAERLGARDVGVVRADGATPFRDGSFDAVGLNPPIRAGLEVVLALVRGAARALRPHGALYMVVRVRQGAKRVARLALEWFAEAEQVARAAGYLVFRLAGPRPATLG